MRGKIKRVLAVLAEHTIRETELNLLKPKTYFTYRQL